MYKNLHSLVRTIGLILLIYENAYAQASAKGNIWESWEKVAELPFPMRDGVGVVNFKNELWLLGGWKYGPLSSEIYKSSDAVHWERVGSAPWPGRHGAGTVVFKNKIWVLSGDGHPDVWSSEDGVNWIQEVEKAPWGKRYAPYVVVYEDKIWLMGGVSYWDEEGNYSTHYEKPFNDIWSSTDGVNWELACASAPWGARGMIHGSVVFNDEMWILGGGSKSWDSKPTSIYNDVWKSKDGINWELMTDNAAWSPRIHFTAIVFEDKLWAIDGTTSTEALTNEVWYSEDGKEWTSLNSKTTLPFTHASTVFVHDNALYVAAGYGIDAIYRYTPPKKQLLHAGTLPAVTYGMDTLNLDVRLNSGLHPVYHIMDNDIAEPLPNKKLLIKEAGKTELALFHPGSYGYFPLDTVFLEFHVLKKGQNIHIGKLQAKISANDTIKIDAYADSGLPVKIKSSNDIKLISDNKFMPKRSGLINVELIQKGSQNYSASTQNVNFYVYKAPEYTIFPNPAHNYIKLMIKGDPNIDQFVITSPVGKIVKVFAGQGGSKFFNSIENYFTLNVEGLPPGMYVLTIYSQNKSTSLRFFKGR